MNRDEFVEPQRLNLLEVSDGWAFLPPRVPPEFEITPAILRAADAARGAVSELSGSTRVAVGFEEATLMLFRPLAINEAVSSARIEGIHTQVVDLVIRDVAPKAHRASLSADAEARILEAQNAAATVQLGYDWLREGREFGVPLIKDLHGRILQSARGGERNPGGLRTRQVWLGQDGDGFQEASYVPPPPEHVAPLLEDLAVWLAGPPTFGALIDIAIGHYQFEAIHPFEDGNGRLGRALVPLHLVNQRVMDGPWLAISSAMDHRRDEYLTRLKRVSTSAEWGEWVVFFLAAAAEQAHDSLRRVRRAIELREEYRRRLTGLPSGVPGRVLDYVLERVFVSAVDIATHSKTTYPTARTAIDDLVRVGVLEPWGKLGSRHYWHAAAFLADVYESGFSGNR